MVVSCIPMPSSDFPARIDALRNDLVAQGRRVQALVEVAFEAVFSRNEQQAARVAQDDDAIDVADVALEKASVQLLADATLEGASLDVGRLRDVLTIVKVNNELERIADAAVDVAALVQTLRATSTPFPGTFRVMANSIIGIVRDANSAVYRRDAALARVVLQSQHCVTAFKDAILRDAEAQISKGAMTVEFAFLLHEIASLCELIADHCTNVSEQVIYTVSGAIVRHTAAQWVEVPGSAPP